MSKFSATVFLFILALPAFSQESDTVNANVRSDTILRSTSDSIFRLGASDLYVTDTLVLEFREPKNPTKALMYALVLPGLGQAYNGKHWKIPIVWGALGGVGYAIAFNTNGYREATYRYLDEPSDVNERWIELWKRNVELSYIVGILVYGLQILDAYVDANLYTWDVNDNLSMRIAPSVQPLMTPANLNGYTGGLTCSFKIKRR